MKYLILYGTNYVTKVNAYNGFDPLTEVWLGAVYPVDFYYDFESEVRDALTKITEMTMQDLAKISKLLESKNIKVQRPTFFTVS